MNRINFRNRPAIIVEKQCEKPENDIVRQRNFQQTKYIEFLTRFINEKCEYDYQRLTHINPIHEAYKNFMTENKEILNQYNVNFSLTPSDIPKLDNRFEAKQIQVCKHCLCKQFVGCCDKYVRLDRTKHSYIVNLKLI
tara:strand:- start:282 stop:695 length:414 start_codon:yes stop_codon:yes gene_type:complete